MGEGGAPGRRPGLTSLGAGGPVSTVACNLKLALGDLCQGLLSPHPRFLPVLSLPWDAKKWAPQPRIQNSWSTWVSTWLVSVCWRLPPS